LNSVDYTQKTAAPPQDDDDDILKALRSVIPYHWIWTDPVALKRLKDNLADSMSAQDTSPTEDAQLRQESPDPEDRPAMTREAEDEFWQNPEGWRKEREKYRKL